MLMNKRKVGTDYEQKAAKHLTACGYHIIHENFRCKIGEIDLIGYHEGYLTFIEVKYRSSTMSGYPAEAITPNKRKTILRTAQYYMLLHNIPEDTPCRFDVVVILENQIDIIADAFYD